MSKIIRLLLIVCFVNFAYGGVTRLVPKFIKKRVSNMVPDGVNLILYGPQPPTEELMAVKRFALEVELAGDEDRLNDLRMKLLKVLEENIQDFPSQPEVKKRPSFLKSKLDSIKNSLLNYTMDIVQPKVSMNMQPMQYELQFNGK